MTSCDDNDNNYYLQHEWSHSTDYQKYPEQRYSHISFTAAKTAALQRCLQSTRKQRQLSRDHAIHFKTGAHSMTRMHININSTFWSGCWQTYSHLRACTWIYIHTYMYSYIYYLNANVFATGTSTLDTLSRHAHEQHQSRTARHTTWSTWHCAQRQHAWYSDVTAEDCVNGVRRAATKEATGSG